MKKELAAVLRQARYDSFGMVDLDGALAAAVIEYLRDKYPTYRFED